MNKIIVVMIVTIHRFIFDFYHYYESVKNDKSCIGL